MRAGVKAAVLLIGGGIVGLLSAQIAVPYNADALPGEGAAWATYLRETPQPYQRAHYLLAGQLPPPPTLIFEAETGSDSTGAALEAGCTYRVGIVSAARRWWHLAALPNGGVTSATSVLSTSGGAAEILVSAQPQSSNWLNSGTGRFKLVFTASRDSLTPSAPVVMPTVERVDCR